tara:strand:+ start:212420 stop:213295 length:876 start_codon:yes stop_codon:yes gene_type:complete
MSTENTPAQESSLPDEQAEPPATPKPSPGALLQAQRETLELSLQQVSEKLNLTMHYVRSLESDSFDKLPADIFVRGYIRNYANLLGLDPVHVLQVYADFTVKKQARKEEAIKRYTRRRRDKNRPWVLFSGIAFVVVAVALWWLSSTEDVAELTSQASSAPQASSALQVSSASQISSAPESVDLTDNVTVFDDSAETATLPEAPAIALAWPGDDTLEIDFDSECWVEVEHRGSEETYRELQHAGDRLHITGTAPFTVMLGNARAVTVSYNNRHLDISNNIRQDDTARLSVGL